MGVVEWAGELDPLTAEPLNSALSNCFDSVQQSIDERHTSRNGQHLNLA